MSDCLVVLHAGLWGNGSHLWCVEKSIRDNNPGIHILMCKRSDGNHTYDGLDVLGERVAAEVNEYITKEPGIRQISFVGYSLGGLALRYAIGVLYDAGLFEKVQAKAFTTFATPHVGVHPASSGVLAWVLSSLGPRSISVTGAHLFMTDGLVRRRPLLELMTEPDSAFMKGLAVFETRTCYANIVHDRLVRYYTASISPADPYAHMDKLRLRRLDKYGGVVLDPAAPFEILAEGEEAEIYKYSVSTREFIFRTVLIAGLPLWLAVYFVSAAVSNIKSAWRIRSHRKEHPDTSDRLFAQEMLEEAVAAVGIDDPTSATSSVTALGSETDGHPTKKTTFGKLDLSESTRRMIRNLDSLKWNRFQVHIRRTQLSHNAIISRNKESDRFKEGHDVLRHWADHISLC
ncbi:hypothetical protein PYCC9005_005149 [Savitreella phatthalungensis]